MSQINAGVATFEMECGKRETKLTVKALVNKIKRLQRECKMMVTKIKGLIPEMKALTKRKENASHVQSRLESVIQLYENATVSHNMVIPVFPEDEQNKQNE